MMVLERTLACSGTLHDPTEFLVLTTTPQAAGYYYFHDRWNNVRRGQNNCIIEPRLCFNGNAGVAWWHMRTQFVQVLHANFGSHYDFVLTSTSYLEMVRAAAEGFPSSVYEPPPESSSNAPSLNLNLGGVNVSLGGPSGSGVYRTSSDNVGIQAEGIRDGVRNLFGKVKQGVDKIGL
jgi:hypothetical protein